MAIIDIISEPNSDYANRMITNSIATLGSISYSKMIELRQLMTVYISEILSEISLHTAKTNILIHSFAKIQDEEYLQRVYEDMLDIKHTSNDVIQIDTLQLITQDIENNLNNIRSKIEDTYELSENSISIYNDDPVENGIDYTVLKFSSPIIFKYYEGKILFRKITDFTKIISDVKNENESDVETIGNTYLGKLTRILENSSNAIQKKLELRSLSAEIKDIVLIAKSTYDYYDLGVSNKLDLFLGRSYEKIKDDIIEVIENM